MNISSVIDAAATFNERRKRVKKIRDFMKHDLRVTIPSLTKEQRQMVDEVWKGIRVNDTFFAFFNMFNEEGRDWTPLYFPSDLFYSIVDIHYNDYRGANTIEDKNFNSLFFYDVKQPITVARNMGGTTSPSSPCFLAGVEGFEPSSTVLETAALPLNYTPIKKMVRVTGVEPALVGTRS